MALPQERRQYGRLNALVDVAYSKHPEESMLQLSRNISKGGICLIVYDELKEGDLLDLKIFLPDSSTPVETVGQVVWASEFVIGDSVGKRFDVGIEFVKISDGDKDRIEQYVFSHMK